MILQWGSISIEGSPSCILLLRPTSQPLPSRPISLLPILVSLSWVARLAPLLTVRRCSRCGWKRSRSLYMEDSQLQTTLLRSCLSFPKISYILRTCPPSHILQATRNFDTAIRGSLEDILGGPCPEWSGLKASLPSSHGGLNLRDASLHAPAAFVRSL